VVDLRAIRTGTKRVETACRCARACGKGGRWSVVGGGLGEVEVEVEAATAHSLVGSQLTGELMTDRDNNHAYECGWTDPCVGPAQLERSPSSIGGAENGRRKSARPSQEETAGIWPSQPDGSSSNKNQKIRHQRIFNSSPSHAPLST
jgi:hypothetical protein